MKKKYIVPAAMLGTVALLTACGAGSGKGTLKVGVRDDIMNFGYLNPDTDKYYGFEIDLAQELSNRLGYSSVEYVTVTPDTRETSLENGDVDCIVAAYSVSDERREKFDLSPVYYEDVSGVVVENSSLITGFKDLVGKNIGGLEGANTREELKSRLIEAGLITEQDVKDTTFTYVASYEELNRQLEEGTLDAICMDGCIAKAYMDETSSFLEEIIDTEEYSVATQKDSELSAGVAEAVQAMLDDGTIDGFKDKWD